MTRTNWTIQPREGFRENLDQLRKAEPDLPSRTEMLHRVVSQAMDELKAENDRQEDIIRSVERMDVPQG